MAVEEKIKIDSFTKLVAWQMGHKLVLLVLKTCEQIPYRDPLRNQMERAAISITSNIAEGFGRHGVADKKHFYVIARGSAYELQNQLLICRDTSRITEVQFQELAAVSRDSVRLLHGLIRSIGGARHASS